MNVLGNPEFVRNAWLELTPQRVVAMPVVLALILLVAALGDFGAAGLSHVAMTLFVVVAVLWGAKLAGDSMSEELAQGTWDSQRLSSLGAWAMTVGKLFGGPVFAWYGGLLCLAVFCIASPADPYTTLRSALIAVGTAIAVHALALLSNLMAWRKLPRGVPTQRSAGAALLLALLLVPQVLGWMVSDQALGDVRWYGGHFAGADFALLCAVLAVFWSVLGLYRSMREELAFRDPPTAWIAFLLFLFWFIGGWFHAGAALSESLPEARPIVAHLAACALIALAAAYCLLFGERKDWVRLRRMVALARGGERRRAYELMPKWLATAGLTFVVAGAFAACAVITQPWRQGVALTAVALGCLVFLVRDGALILGLNFTRDQRRADAAAALYLAVLYVLFPALLAGLGLQVFSAVFWPPLLYQQPQWVVLMLLQAAAALDFALRRWRRLPAAAWASVAGPRPP